MEMPINVIIVLFVAVIVGGIVLIFSNQTLLKSQSELDKLRDDPASKDIVVELDTADPTQLLSLANECVRKSKQEGVMDQKLCFAVFATTVDVSGLNGKTLANDFRLDATRVTTGSKAVRITYHPGGFVIMSS